MRSKARRVAVSLSLVVAAALGVAGSARASLTVADEQLVRETYARSEAGSAARIRATIGRPDVTSEQAQKLFADAARAVPFDEKHAALIRDLLFGPVSEAARSDLVPVVVGGLLARSAEVAGGSANDALRAAELVRLHRFVAVEIGAAGTPPREGHDANAGVRDDALRAAVALYRTHLASPVLDRARLGEALLAGRAEAELALIELSSGLAPRADVAGWLGVGADARAAFEKSGVLVVGLDAGPAKAKSVLLMLEAAGLSAHAASALWIDKPRPLGVAARRGVLVALAPLSGSLRRDGERLWSSSVEPVSPDAALAEIAFTLGRAATASAFESTPAIVEAASRMIDRVRRAGAGASVLAPAAMLEAPSTDHNGEALSPEGLVAHAAELLLLDAPRVTSMALVRTLAGRPEAMEQLALALGVLATGEDGKLRPQVDLGRVGDGGLVFAAPVTQIHGTPERVTDFVLDGHTIAIGRDDAGAVTRVERDGKPLSLATIPFARVPTLGGEAWSSPGRAGRKPLAITRLFGAPEVGVLDDSRFLVRGGLKPKGRDAIALKALSDAGVDADLRLGGAGPSIVMLRAAATPTGFSGAALVLDSTDDLHASLVALDGSGGVVPIGGPVAITKPGPLLHVRLDVYRDVIQAIVGGQTISGQLPAPLAAASGDLAFAPGDRSEIEVKNLKVGPPKRH